MCTSMLPCLMRRLLQKGVPEALKGLVADLEWEIKTSWLPESALICLKPCFLFIKDDIYLSTAPIDNIAFSHCRKTQQFWKIPGYSPTEWKICWSCSLAVKIVMQRCGQVSELCWQLILCLCVHTLFILTKTKSSFIFWVTMPCVPAWLRSVGWVRQP